MSDDKNKRITDAIVDIGSDREPPDGWVNRVLDAADYAERVKRVVWRVVVPFLNDTLLWAPETNAEETIDAADAISTRVAEQLTAPGPVLSAEERETIEAAKAWRDNVATNSGDYLGPTNGLEHERALIAAIDRLLGATR